MARFSRPGSVGLWGSRRCRLELGSQRIAALSRPHRGSGGCQTDGGRSSSVVRWRSRAQTALWARPVSWPRGPRGACAASGVSSGRPRRKTPARRSGGSARRTRGSVASPTARARGRRPAPPGGAAPPASTELCGHAEAPRRSERWMWGCGAGPAHPSRRSWSRFFSAVLSRSMARNAA
jgi:hypothetical protein